jgi:hypothetical protein
MFSDGSGIQILQDLGEAGVGEQFSEMIPKLLDIPGQGLTEPLLVEQDRGPGSRHVVVRALDEIVETEKLRGLAADVAEHPQRCAGGGPECGLESETPAIDQLPARYFEGGFHRRRYACEPISSLDRDRVPDFSCFIPCIEHRPSGPRLVQRGG